MSGLEFASLSPDELEVTGSTVTKGQKGTTSYKGSYLVQGVLLCLHKTSTPEIQVSTMVTVTKILNSTTVVLTHGVHHQ